MSKNSDNSARFELIVKTIISSQEIDPGILRAHVQEYATANGLTYDLARQAITLVVKDRIIKKLSQI